MNRQIDRQEKRETNKKEIIKTYRGRDIQIYRQTAL